QDDDEFDNSYEALIRLSERLGDAKPKGVSADQLESLRNAHSLDPPTLARPGLDKETRCGICLCDYEDDDDCMLTVCEHGFHDECLRSWLTQKGTCPCVLFLSLFPSRPALTFLVHRARSVCRRDHVSA
ncbi:uncharacterized protein RHOBADRAFT_17833, partial [Rhodotorula graminis WP1]